MHNPPPQTSDLPLPPPPETPMMRALKTCMRVMHEENLDLNETLSVSAMMVRNAAHGVAQMEGNEDSTPGIVHLFLSKLAACFPGSLQETTIPQEAPSPPAKLQRRRLKLGGN